MESTLGWSMPLEHSGIIHDTIGKKMTQSTHV